MVFSTLRALQYLPYFAAVTALTGCGDAELAKSNRGQLDRVGFQYSSFTDCPFGCSLDQPLLAGSSIDVQLSNVGDVDELSVRSSDSGVAMFALRRSCACERNGAGEPTTSPAVDGSCSTNFTLRCDDFVETQTVAAGDATLELFVAGGELLDRAIVHAREPATATFVSSTGGDRETVHDLVLGVGDNHALRVELTDADGQTLLADSGVHFSVDDPNVAAFPTLLAELGSKGLRSVDGGDRATLVGIAPGTTTLEVAARSIDAALSVVVR